MELWVFALLFALAGFVAWLMWTSWRDRAIDFLDDVPVGIDVEAARERILDSGVPVLVASGFRTVAHVAHTTILERRYTPGWVWWIVIFFFPFGLVALLARGSETITIASSGDTLRVNGHCGKRLADSLVENVDRVAAEMRPPV